MKSSSESSTSTYEYKYEDRTTADETTYYRLKQIDTNGQFEYSQIISIKNQLKNLEVNVFPNPSKDFITISGVSSESQIIITNNTNKIVLDQMINDGETVDISRLTDGVYTIIISNNSKKSTQRLEKI